jgi:uncharacterized protein YndB with AHSA1/START domain
MPDPNSLELSIQIAAKPSTVFRFLSDPKLFQQWMGTGAILGQKDLTVSYPGGEIAKGTIREVIPDQKLVFGWGYVSEKHGLAPDSTIVTLELIPTPDGGTLVKLTHTNLDPSQQSEHSKGWTYYLHQLSTHAETAAVSAAVPEIIAAYCDAWNQTEPELRRELLGKCWEPNGAFRDAMGSAETLQALDGYIAGAHQFLPGFRLEAAGPHDFVRGFVRFPWIIRLPDGKVMSRGTNFGRVSATGKFEFVTGFWDAA